MVGELSRLQGSRAQAWGPVEPSTILLQCKQSIDLGDCGFHPCQLWLVVALVHGGLMRLAIAL